MSRTTRPRRALNATLALALVAAVAAAPIEAGQKKGKKKNQTAKQTTTQTTVATSAPAGLAEPPAAVVEASKHLLAYDTEAARREIEGVSATDDAWVATVQGRILLLENDLEAAAAECRRAAEVDPANPAPALCLGDSLAYAEKGAAAKEAYAQSEKRARALLAVQADDLDTLFYLGAAQQRQERFDEAAATLGKVRAERPDDPEVLFQLGATRFYQQKWQQAFDDLSAALKLDSGIALAYYYRGLAAAKLNRKDVLFNDLDRFVKMAPKSPEAANARQILSSFG